MKICLVLEAGTVGYREALAWQEQLVADRRGGQAGDTLLLLEHPPVFTFGRKGGRENMLVSEESLRRKGIAAYSVNRGGNVTFHGPGQLVGYPIIGLNEFTPDVHWYLVMLEEVLIRAAGEYGVPAGRRPGHTGVWVGELKLASIGVAVRGWVTMHGFALNVSNDLKYFEMINPCGLKNVSMTSLSSLLGRTVNLGEAAQIVKRHFGGVFGVKMEEARPADKLMRVLPRQQAPGICVSEENYAVKSG